ncbi:MAG: PmoA family protein [Sedimentisphaerales bacterium]|nr:PmoA family protein [Sedimentisphaerales bacterium]
MTRHNIPLEAAKLAVILCVFGCTANSAEQTLNARIEKDKVVVTIEGKVFTCYKFSNSQKYPYFWPVNGPASGKSVTTETSEPYPHHHSLFFGCDRVNGANFWQDTNERGQIISEGPEIIQAKGLKITFSDECLWRQGGAEPVIRDVRRVTIAAPTEETRLIDFDITLEPLTDITILNTNHSLFSARVVPELSVKSGGTLVNAEGKTAEKDTFGVTSPWCDYFGSRDGVTEGIAILQNPDNRWFPCKWFTRDYGFFSPTPMNWLENGKLELPKGEKLRLRYRAIVHSGDTRSARIDSLFNQYRHGTGRKIP